MLSPDRWIRASRRRLLGQELVLEILGPLAAVVWSWAGLLLAAKLWWPVAVPVALWAGALLVPAASIWRFTQRRPTVSRSDAAVWLDHELEAGGLIVALEEAPDERWAALLPQSHQRWRESLPRGPWSRVLQSLAWPALFLTGTMMIPARQPVSAAVVETTLGQETARKLADMAGALDSLPLFDPAEKAQLKSEIAALSEEVKRAPLTHEKWETVDALRQRLKFRVDQAGSELGQAGQILSLLTAAMDAGGGPIPADQQRQLEQQALGVVQKFATPENLSRLQSLVEQPAVREMLQQGVTSLPSDPAQRQELLQGLQQAVSGEARELQSLQNLLPMGDASKSLAAAAMGGAISSLLGGSPLPTFPGMSTSKVPAKPLFGDADLPRAERFRPQPSTARPATDSGAGRPPTPSPQPGPPPARPGQVVAGASPTGEAWTRQISPRHRAAVKRYFGDASASSLEEN